VKGKNMLIKQSQTKWTLLSGFTVALIGAWIVSGCSSQDAPAPSASTSPSTQPVHAAVIGSTTHKSGNQLWSENCSRCHNIRPPEYFSDAQWDIIAHHMRLRANLTGEEQRKIVEFLQASN
jgi:hypothetical protein